MTDHFAFAFIVLGYLLVPIVAYGIYWIWTKLRRTDAANDDGET